MECRITYACYAIRDDYAFKAGATIECSHTYASHPVRYRYACKRGTTKEHRIAYALHTVPDGDVFKAATTTERRIPYARHTVRNYNAFKAGTTIERPVGYRPDGEAAVGRRYKDIALRALADARNGIMRAVGAQCVIQPLRPHSCADRTDAVLPGMFAPVSNHIGMSAGCRAPMICTIPAPLFGEGVPRGLYCLRPRRLTYSARKSPFAVLRAVGLLCHSAFVPSVPRSFDHDTFELFAALFIGKVFFAPAAVPVLYIAVLRARCLFGGVMRHLVGMAAGGKPDRARRGNNSRRDKRKEFFIHDFSSCNKFLYSIFNCH